MPHGLLNATFACFRVAAFRGARYHRPAWLGLIAAALLAGGPVPEAWAQASDRSTLHEALRLPPEAREQRPDRNPVITAIDISSSGRMLATGGDNHDVYLWDRTTDTVKFILRGHLDWVRTVRFTPDESLLITAGDDCRVCIWDTRTGTLRGELPPMGHVIYSLDVNPAGDRLACGGFAPAVRVFNLATRRPSGVVPAPSTDVRCVRFSPDGQSLAIAGRGGTVDVVDVATRQVRHSFEVGCPRLHAVAFSPDGHMLAAAGEHREVHVWSLDDGAKLRGFAPPAGRTYTLRFLDNARLALAGSDNVIRVWNVTEDQPELELWGHRGTVAALSYDDKRKQIVSGGFDTTVRAWPLDRGAITRRPTETTQQ